MLFLRRPIEAGRLLRNTVRVNSDSSPGPIPEMTSLLADKKSSEGHGYPGEREKEEGASKQAVRNLRRGLFCLLVAAGVAAGLGVVDGGRGLFAVGVALGTFALVWVFERLKSLGQPNGAFYVLGVVALFGSLAGVFQVALERVRTTDTRLAQRPALESAIPSAAVEVAPKEDYARSLDGGQEVVPSAPNRGVLEGDTAPVAMAPEAERLLTLREARRRFPQIWVVGTPQNQSFVEAAERLKKSSPQLLLEPDWVLRLAESLDREEGWEKPVTRPVGTTAPQVPEAAVSGGALGEVVPGPSPGTSPEPAQAR
jgi:hypothetical protein